MMNDACLFKSSKGKPKGFPKHPTMHTHAFDSFQTKPDITLVMYKMKIGARWGDGAGRRELRALPLGIRLVLPECFTPSYAILIKRGITEL
jgi:hypothetical protein